MPPKARGATFQTTRAAWSGAARAKLTGASPLRSAQAFSSGQELNRSSSPKKSLGRVRAYSAAAGHFGIPSSSS